MTQHAPLADLPDDAAATLRALGVSAGGDFASYSPISGEQIGAAVETWPDRLEPVLARAHAGFLCWRTVPAPRRGELVRLFGEELRANKAALGRLVTLEAGKTVSEGLGEVQEMIDICDFAVGLSRQLHGLTIASERPRHRMMETWHPLGVVGVISAFNFPVAVWAWNAALAVVCGDSVVWKPSEKTPLCAVAVQALWDKAAARFGADADGVSQTVIGARTLGETLVKDPRVALVSATGSTRMGREVGPLVAERFGRVLLELGGNNAAIIAPSADLALVLRGVAFAAMGTAGQRCTTLRRLLVHERVYDAFLPKLKKAYASAPVGDPRRDGVLIGPLIDGEAYGQMQFALEEARREGGVVTGGERVLEAEAAKAFYVRPAIVESAAPLKIAMRETFAPILYVTRYADLDAAIAENNAAAQGLSSSIFTSDLREAERFVAADGSDCGIANVNIGPSGAEIGGAFGGEKETGGGRESGSDSWKAYMRRQTSTVNYGADLPLAQGVSFDISE